MGIALPQLAPASEDRVSGAQVIDNSLKFDRDNKTHLLKTFSTIGSSSRFTWSYWIKRTKFGVGDQRVFSSSAGNGNPGFVNWFTSNDVLEARHYNGSAWDIVFQTTNKFRDTGWYHIVCAVDVTESATTDRIKIYVNGTRETLFNNTTYGPARYAPLVFNGSNKSAIGAGTAGGNEALDAHLSNYYAIDGFALGPESFGYTDPLTGVWRPKKFSGELNPPFSDNWEGDTTGTGFNADTNKQNAFDGNPNTQSATGQNGTMSFTPTPAITGISKVRIKARRDAGQATDSNFTLNGTTIGNLWTAGTTATVEITSLGGSPITQLTNLTWKANTNNNEWFGVYQIEVYSNGAYHTLRQGGNAFYLPMDGSSQIGIDQSGKGNDFTPVNFGGSVELDKATGARPILNTGSGGTVARSGVFGSDVSATYATTSASNSGGKYYFSHDASAQPTFSFIRGATYIFDYSASSSHPLRFATAADAAGSTEYTDGTSISGNVIKFTVPHNAPDTLYYYCNVHNGMGNSISVTTDETKADPYAWKCTVAMPLLDYANGTRADFSHDINCTTASKSTDYDSISAFSSPGDMFYDKVAKFEGDGSSNDRVRIPTGSFAMGTGDFTIEFWGHFTATGDQGNRNARILTPQSESGSYFQFLSSSSASKVQFKFNGGGDSDIAIENSLCLNRTRHYVYQRTGTTGQLIVDGVLYDTGTDNVNYPDVAYQIGRYDASNGGASLWMSDLRVYTGIQKYSTTGKSVGDQLFIPASTSPDILPDTPSGVAVKPKLKKTTDGSVSIDRSSNEYLQVPASTNFRLDGQYCIEFFLKLTQYSNDSVYVRTFVLDGPTGDGGSTNIHLNVNPSNGAILLWSGSSELIGAQLHVTGNWHHICLTRDSSNKTRLFVDGVLNGSATVTTDHDPNSGSPRPRLGALGDTGGTSGYYSNLRIIKGSIPTEYQTSTTTNFDRAFYPPSEPLTTTSQGATANDVKLIACQDTVEPGGAVVSPTISGSNNGTQWSHYVTGDVDISFPAWRAFRNDTSSVGCRTQTANGATIVWQPPSPIAFSSSFKIWAARDGTHAGTTFTVTHAGGDTDFTSSVVTSTTQTAVDLAQISGVTSPITKITIVSGGPNPRFSGIEVDSVMLVDPVSPRNGALATNFNPFNTDIDAVRGQETSYCTWSPIFAGADKLVISDSLLTAEATGSNGAGNWKGAVSTLGATSGKWYAEFLVAALGGSNHANIGISPIPKQTTPLQGQSDGGHFYNVNGGAWNAGSTSNNVHTAAVAGDIIGVTVDFDASEIKWYLNGVLDYTVSLNSNITTNGFVWALANYTTSKVIANFGQKPFKFPPPDGFQLLTSSALTPDATDTIPFVTRPDKYQGPLKYTGKPGGFQQDQNKIAFTPDMVWVKRRNAAEQHKLYDTVRGKTGSNFYHIEPNNNTASAGESGAITEMLPGGFYATGGGHVNSDGEPFIAWMWRAGGGNTTGSSGNEFWKDGVNVGSAANAQVGAGSQNSSAYDTSDTWSDDLSSPNGAYSNSPVTNAFNGNLTNGFEAGNPSNNYSTIRFQPASPITVNTQIRIHVFDYNGSNVTYQWRVNDGSWNNMPGTSSPYRRWQDLSFTGSLTSFEYRSNTSVTYKPTLYAVEIDGKILVNTGTDLSGLTQYPSIPATACSIGTKQGFSICQYTSPSSYDSSTWAHGLSQAPDFIMSRMLNAGGAITIYHSAVPDKYFLMNSNAAGAGSNNWTVTSGTVTMGAGLWTSNNQNSIAYHWHNVPGLQKFGKYKCNGDGSGGGDEDGPFVELGFKPAMILFKGSNYTSDYTWIDQERCTTNYNDVAMRANYHYGEIGNARGGVGSSSQPENYAVDFLSNGFKVRASGGSLNSGTNEVWYAAWAEAPQFNLYGAQSNAR